MIILQTNRREDFDIVGYGECPGCKTENNLVQNRTIECSMCGEPYLKNKWKGVSWCEWERDDTSEVSLVVKSATGCSTFKL